MMRSTLKTHSTLIISLSLTMLCSSLANSLFASSTGNSLTTTRYAKPPTSEDLPIQIGAGVRASQLMVREESLISQRYYSFNLSFAYTFSEDSSITLGQSVQYTPEVSSSSAYIREDDNKIQIGVTTLTLSHIILKSFEEKFYISTSLGGALYHSEYYADLTRIANGSASLSMGIVPLSWLSYEISPAYTYYHHKDTFAYDGESNTKQSYSLSHKLILNPLNTLSFTLSYANYLYDQHEDAEDLYYYSTGARLDWIADEQFTVFTGISTLNSQVANDNVAAVVLSNKDATYITGGVDYKFF